MLSIPRVASGADVARAMRERTNRTREMARNAMTDARQAEEASDLMRSEWNDFAFTHMMAVTDVSGLTQKECADTLRGEEYCLCDLSDLKCVGEDARPRCEGGSSVPILTRYDGTGFYCATERDDPIVRNFVSKFPTA